MDELPEVAVERLARVNRLLLSQRTLPAKLEAIVTMVKRTVPGCDSAGVILLVDDDPTTTAVSDRLTVEIDLVQYDTGEGPCLEAIQKGEVIRIDLVAEDERFRRLAPGAIAHDVNSVLSLPLTAHGDDVGALDLYSHEANAFDDATEELVKPLADYAADVIASSPLYAYSLDMIERLTESIEAQALVSRATGVLMATEGLNDVEALDRLRHLALSSGQSMPTVANWLLKERPTLSGSEQSRQSDDT